MAGSSQADDIRKDPARFVKFAANTLLHVLQGEDPDPSKVRTAASHLERHRNYLHLPEMQQLSAVVQQLQTQHGERERGGTKCHLIRGQIASQVQGILTSNTQVKGFDCDAIQCYAAEAAKMDLSDIAIATDVVAAISGSSTVSPLARRHLVGTITTGQATLRATIQFPASGRVWKVLKGSSGDDTWRHPTSCALSERASRALSFYGNNY